MNSASPSSPPDPRPASVKESGVMVRSAPLRGASAALRVLAVCAAIATLHFAAPLLLPVVLAILLFYALNPIVNVLTRWYVPRALASVLVVAALVTGAGAGAVGLWPQVDAVVAKIPDGAAKLRTTFRRARGGAPDSALERVQAAAKAIDSAAAEATGPAERRPGVTRVEIEQPVRVSDWLVTGGIGAIGLMGQLVTILFLTMFLLNEDDSFKRKLVRQMETRGTKRVTVSILNDIAQRIQSFLWVQLISSSLVAVVTGLVLWWLGVEQPAAWGLFAGLMNLVPYFGALVVAVVLAAVGFLQFGTLEGAVLVAGASLAITTVEGLFITPHFISRAASLNHVAIFLAIAFWSWAWGAPGMLLAVPLLMAIKAVCDHVEGLKGFGEFLGE
ncbi:MAG: AI-2E family transporter [Vicinamibacterales bacterium]